MRNLSNCFCFLEVKVLAEQNVSLDGKEGCTTGHGCFKVFCPGPSLELEDKALGRVGKWCPGQVEHLEKCHLHPGSVSAVSGTLLLVLLWLCWCCIPSATT